jgi:uncharacterized OB-fold protein
VILPSDHRPDDAAPRRPRPLPDALSWPFWESARSGELALQRCQDCGEYFLPFSAYCSICASGRLAFERVSGRGVIYSFSVTASGARTPYFASRTPYVLGLVEVVEQPGLIMYSNFPYDDVDALAIGAKVEVCFVEIGDGLFLPEFRLSASS